MNVVDIARLFSYVRETTIQNRGLRVEAIQHWSQGAYGDSWCAEFATMVLDIYFQGNSPVPRVGSCQIILDLAKREGWVTKTPVPGDLFFYVNQDGHAHHVGFVTQVSPLTGIAGNTSEDGTSSNGDGVHEHAINTTVFVHYPEGGSL